MEGGAQMRKIAVVIVDTVNLDGTLTDVTIIKINGNVSKIFLPGQGKEFDEYIAYLDNLGYEIEEE